MNTSHKDIKMEKEQRKLYPEIPPLDNIPLRQVDSQWQDLFNLLDKDADGRVSVVQLRNRLASHNYEVPRSTINFIVNSADTNSDGYITLSEFIELMKTPQAKPLFRRYMQRYVTYFVPRKYRAGSEDVDGAYENEYTCFPPALGMIFFSTIMILIFVYDRVQSGSSTSPNSPFFSIFVYNPKRREEIWRFLTYMFIHASVEHIGTNICVQILLGIPLEMVHRWWRVLIVYLLGVVSGTLFTTMVDPKVYLAGASGGVYALLTAHIATIILNWKEMDYPLLQLFIFMFLIVTDTSQAIYNRYYANIPTKIAYAAHFGGAMAGFLVGIYVLRNLRVRNWERALWWICFILFNSFLVVAIFWNIIMVDKFPPQIHFGEKLFNSWK